ncbi:MAG TPA: O-antigen ligase family protein [Verrucomicrobiae bacterium]|jgi:hypothetical protein
MRRFAWHWGLTIMMFLYVLAAQTLTDIEGWSRLTIVLAVALALMLVVAGAAGVCCLRLGSWLWIPVAFLAYCWIQSFFDLEVGLSKALLPLFSSYLGGAAVALSLQAGVSLEAFVSAQMVAVICNIVAGFFGIGTVPPPGETEVRYTGLTGNANEFAVLLMLDACFAWLLPSKSGRLACVFGFVAVGYAIATTGSRTALVAVPFFALLICAQVVFKMRNKRKIYAIAAVLGLCAAGAVAAPFVLEKTKDVTSIHRALTHDDTSFMVRKAMLHKAFTLWQDAPIFGQGFDAYKRIAGYGGYAHDDYVEILCDLGLFGAMLFYSMHMYILLKSKHLPTLLKFPCRVMVVTLLALDAACVNYYMKTPIMCLFVLLSITADPQCLNGSAFSEK